MGSCLCKSTKDLTKVFIDYKMNDLSSVYKDTQVKSIDNEKYKAKEISKDGDRKS